MAAAVESFFLNIPFDIRLQIYSYLLPDGGAQKRFYIAHYPNTPLNLEAKKRSKYYTTTALQRRYYETTYRLVCPTTKSLQNSSSNNINAGDGSETTKGAYTQIMAVNRQIYGETSYYLYAGRSFDFGTNIEAVSAFLSDLLPPTRQLITEVRVRKRGGPGGFYAGLSDNVAWKRMCDTLGSMKGEDREEKDQKQKQPLLQTLAVEVEGRKPKESWEGPQELTVHDFRLLSGLRTECLEWITALAAVAKAVRHLRVIPKVFESSAIPKPECTESILFAAFSASLTRGGFMAFLRDDLGLPARII